MSMWFVDHEKDSVDNFFGVTLVKNTSWKLHNELLGIFIESWSALDSWEGDNCSQEATQPPLATDFHRDDRSSSGLYSQPGLGGSRTTWPDLVVGRCGMHIHALPGAPQFGVASELIYPGTRARKPPVPAHFHLHQDPHYFHGCGLPRQTAIQLPAERLCLCKILSSTYVSLPSEVRFNFSTFQKWDKAELRITVSNIVRRLRYITHLSLSTSETDAAWNGECPRYTPTRVLGSY